MRSRRRANGDEAAAGSAAEAATDDAAPGAGSHRCNRDGSVRAPVRRARRHDLDPREARGAAALFSRRRRRRRRVGGVFPRRRQAAASRARAACCATWRCGAPALPQWLFDECYQAVGDFAETIAHVLPPPRATSRRGLADWMTSACCRCAASSRTTIAGRSARYWTSSTRPGRFLLLKLLGGGFRVGVSRLLVHARARGLAGVDAEARRAANDRLHRRRPAARRRRVPRADRVRRTSTPARDSGQPYPFFLAHPLQPRPVRDRSAPPATGWSSGSTTASARSSSSAAGQAWVWSRGEELVTERFPGARRGSARRCPTARCSTARSSCWKDGSVAPFAAAADSASAARRLSAKMLAERAGGAASPTTCSSEHGQDLRDAAAARAPRARSSASSRPRTPPALQLSPLVAMPSWDDLCRAARRIARARRRRASC